MSSNKLFVGNISYSATEEQLRELFSGYGTVTNIELFRDKGFGFVEMSNKAEAERARVALSGYNLQGRMLNVDQVHL
jgi:RNA recognition motif-containing protein